MLRTRLQLTCENSCLTCEPHSSGALTPNPNANQRVWCLWSDAMNVCILLLMVLLYHVELASVIQMFVFMSERRKRRKTNFFRKARISKTLFSSCLACYQIVLAVVFHVSCWDLLQPVCHPRHFQTHVLLYCGTPTRSLHKPFGEWF